ncbi:MAG: DNA mismatch repair endonuclease MutL, partial [Chloroflexi bacterium]|nr:DNA mismatch repair endonuclease MutL [Chloroflexota bacterium]
MTIHILAPDVAAKIAAGEVVERPANVAKELIENSLDAGATEIRVEVREGGTRLLRVIDNGHGMRADEAPLAFHRHATSKLESADDLYQIATFGFRGEALYSIAAVSQVTLTTRHKSEDFGTQMRVEGGQITAQGRAGTPVGTIVNMEHLFYNVPARQKFLRKAATEAGQISAILQSYALAYPDRRFSYINDNRLVFQSTGSGDLFDGLVKVYGLEMAKQMVPVGRPAAKPQIQAIEIDIPLDNLEDDVDFMDEALINEVARRAQTAAPQTAIKVSGYASLPTLTRPNRSNIEIFVNRRYVENRDITHAVVQAYHTLLPVGRYPVAVILVEIDPSEVDVNVHPQKTEVRFVNERAVFSAVQKAVRRVVVDQAPVPDLTLPSQAPRSSSAAPMATTEQWRNTTQWGNPTQWDTPPASTANAAQPTLNIPEKTAPFTQLEATKTTPLDLQPAPPVADQASLPLPTAPPPPSAPTRQPLLSERNSQLPPLRVVGQVGAMYIIAEGPEGLYLIDQHAA